MSSSCAPPPVGEPSLILPVPVPTPVSCAGIEASLQKQTALTSLDPRWFFKRAEFTPLSGLDCGAVVSGKVTLQQDLDCTGRTSPALTLIGDGSVLDGNGHRIIAPQAAHALIVQGRSILLQNLSITDAVSGDAILAYDSPDLIALNNDLSRSRVGISIYSENTDSARTQIVANRIEGTLEAGIKFSGTPGSLPRLPFIAANRLRASRGYALHLKTAELELSGSQANDFACSSSAIYLSGGISRISGFNFQNVPLRQNALMVAEADQTQIQSSDFTAPAASASTGEDRIGIHLYKVGNAQIRQVSAWGYDVGLKLATEQAVSGALDLRNSSIRNASQAAILIQAYDQTSFGAVVIQQNDLRPGPNGTSFLLGASTVLGPGSDLSGNLTP